MLGLPDVPEEEEDDRETHAKEIWTGKSVQRASGSAGGVM